MFKRVCSLILALVLFLLPLTSGVGTVRAASAADLETVIAAQYDAFAKSLNPKGASEAVSRLVKHSMKSSSTLNMKANDTFAAGYLNSGLFKAGFVETATVAIQHMLGYNETKMYMFGVVQWYENDYHSYQAACDDKGTNDVSDDERISPIISSQISYSKPVDTYDEGMMLVVGESVVSLTFHQIAADRDTVTYKAVIKVKDSFDFALHGYDGNDKDMANTLTWVGKLLSLGLLNEFKWTIAAELELTVPNPCAHRHNDYLWEFDGTADLVSVPSRTDAINPLYKKQGTYEKGKFIETFYSMHVPVLLTPDQPWEIEWVSKGAGNVLLGEDSSSWRGLEHMRLYKNYLQFGEYVFANEDDEEKVSTHYGINVNDYSINVNEKHTYLLVNRLHEDGSNMVYLYVDGTEIGPMNQYFHGIEKQGETRDWLNGKTLRFFYIGNGSYPLNNVAIEYIRVSEGGTDSHIYDWCRVSTKKPTCTDKGKTTYSCVRCGAVFSESIPAISHEPVTIPGTASTCTASGLSEGSKCNSCGQVLLEQAIIDPLGHSFEDGICTACGEVEYVLGDVDLDGDVDVDDVLALLWNVLFPEDYPIEVNADFDGNGTIDVDDVLKLLWYVLFPEDYPLN